MTYVSAALHSRAIFNPLPYKLSLHPVDRAAIEARIEELIAFLDAQDGDCDLEDGDSDQDHDGREPPESYATLPVFGVDQSLGPVNEREAIRAHRLTLLGRGA